MVCLMMNGPCSRKKKCKAYTAFFKSMIREIVISHNTILSLLISLILNRTHLEKFISSLFERVKVILHPLYK